MIKTSIRHLSYPIPSGCVAIFLMCAANSHGEGEARLPSEPPTVVHYGPDFMGSLLEIESSPPGKLPEVKSGRSELMLNAIMGGAPYRVTLNTSRQIFRLSIPKDETASRFYSPKDEDGDDIQEPPRYADHFRSFSPRLDATMAVAGNFRSVSMLAFKAKQFDDGLMATVEHAVDQGSGLFGSRRSLLVDLANALNSNSDNEGSKQALGLLGAATKIGGHGIEVPPAAAAVATGIEKKFLADPLRSKPLGFYTWSPTLSGIYQRDRMLQDILSPPASEAFAKALGHDAKLLARYQAALRLSERLTNGFANPSLTGAAANLAAGKTPILQDLSLFPASRSYESDLLCKLYENTPIPSDFDLADEMLRRIQLGTLNLEPRKDSGWYDYQTFALEPLVIPDKMPEAVHLELNDSYKQELRKLFKSLLALTRETHVKSVVMLGVPMCMPPPGITLSLRPQLTQEPLATFYLRRAQAYRFVREVLVESFGPTGLSTMKRLSENGAINLTLDHELLVMEALFYGAYLNTAGELGMTPAKQENLGLGETRSLALYQRWKPKEDPDVNQDLRMMVPIFYDNERKLTKVWVVLGATSRPLEIRYATLPTIESVTNEQGEPIDLNQVKLQTTEVKFTVTYPVMAEIYVSNVLNRQEMRALCDQHKTQEAILEHLK